MKQGVGRGGALCSTEAGYDLQARHQQVHSGTSKYKSPMKRVSQMD